MRRITPELADALRARRGQRLLDESAWSRVADILGFSPRELQIVRALFDDRKETTIARDLGISRHTVHTYIERIYQNLDTRSRVELMGAVLAAHLLPSAPSTGIPTRTRAP